MIFRVNGPVGVAVRVGGTWCLSRTGAVELCCTILRKKLVV